MTDTEVLDAAGGVLDAVVDLRRRIHLHPELGLDLPVTQAAVLDEIADLGLEVRTGAALSSVVADLDTGRRGPTILLRADMDALPMPEDSGVEFASTVEGRMHACGHDAHTSMLVGAARVLTARASVVRGRVRFMFQPGEEGDGGAEAMISEGVLDGVDAAFAIHVAPNLWSGKVALRAGPAMASADVVEIQVRGRGGHASTPHWATDPVPVAAEMILALQAMVTRTVDAFNPAVLTISKVRAGTTDNVIPESAQLLGTLRTVDEKVRRAMHDRIPQVADGIAAAHGCTAEVTITHGFPVTVNHAGVVDLVRGVAEESLGAGTTIEMPSPVMGSEDFAYVTQQVPGAMAFLGVCPPEQPDPFSAPACHSNRMVLHEDAMAQGIALHVAVTERLLSDDWSSFGLGDPATAG